MWESYYEPTRMVTAKCATKSFLTLLNAGEVIRNRYETRTLIGGGGFGQIFSGFDKVRQEEVAIKVEIFGVDKKRIVIEHSILVLLRGKSNIPKIRASGEIRGCSYIIMSLLGCNLSELRRKEKDRKLSIGTVFRLAINLCTGLRHMHEAGYLHRDVKPSNCCIGKTEKTSQEVYLIDFGMAGKFKTSSGSFRKPRKYVGFRGTLRYTSLTIHYRREPGPCDDLIGLTYSMIELIKGRLPWTHLKNASDIIEMKKNTPLETLCKDLPLSFLECTQYMMSLKYEEMPDYEKICTLFKLCWPNEITANSPYDWQIQSSSSTKPIRIKEGSIQSQQFEKSPNNQPKASSVSTNLAESVTAEQ